jgi:hypothetical protein
VDALKSQTEKLNPKAEAKVATAKTRAAAAATAKPPAAKKTTTRSKTSSTR